MPCLAPLTGWRAKNTNKETGRRQVVFTKSEAYLDLPVSVPCGKCAGCISRRASDWALRATHEAALWESNVFLTLTYAPESLPKTSSGTPTLRPDDFTDFIRQLRRHLPGVRYLQAGEYGKLGRPHHHALLFNCELETLPWSGQLRRSPLIEQIWKHGHAALADLNYNTAAYVTKYTLKEAGIAQLTDRLPPYQTMSRRPGIGAYWYEAHHADIHDGAVTLNDGTRLPVPRFYMDRLKKRLPRIAHAIEAEKAVHYHVHGTPGAQQNAAKEANIKARMKLAERNLE